MNKATHAMMGALISAISNVMTDDQLDCRVPTTAATEGRKLSVRQLLTAAEAMLASPVLTWVDLGIGVRKAEARGSAYYITHQEPDGTGRFNPRKPWYVRIDNDAQESFATLPKAKQYCVEHALKQQAAKP